MAIGLVLYLDKVVASRVIGKGYCGTVRLIADLIEAFAWLA